MQNLVLLSQRQLDVKGDVVHVCADVAATRLFYVLADGLTLVSIDVASRKELFRCGLIERGLADAQSAVVSIEHIGEFDSVMLCLRNGDVLQVPCAKPVDAECVGSVDAGALAMSWSPDGELVIVATGRGTLFCMSKTFIPVTEVLLTDQEPVQVSVSWEGDGGRFATSTLLPSGKRVLALWLRDCKMICQCEHVKGEDDLGPALTFRPTGFYVASSYTSPEDGNGHVALYESNGLRHGGFPLRKAAAAEQLLWSPDGTLLAAVVLGSIQIWRSSNFVWHLAWELPFSAARASIVSWSQTAPATLVVASRGTGVARLFTLDFGRDFFCSSLSSHSAYDRSLACVVDGTNLKLSDFRKAVVPPPACDRELAIPFVAANVSFFADEQNILHVAALSSDGSGQVYVAALQSATLVASSSKTLPFASSSAVVAWTQLVWVNVSTLLLLGCNEIGAFVVASLDVASGKSGAPVSIGGEGSVLKGARLYCNSDSGLVLLTSGSGQVYVVRVAADGVASVSPQFRLPEPCFHVASVGNVVFARTVRNHLYAVAVAGEHREPVLLDSDCTSFVTHSQFILLTNAQSKLRFVPLVENVSSLKVESQWDRDVETQGLLVTCVPRGARVIINAPRGSLETLYPRPLVERASHSLISARRYGAALELMRKHKLDLSAIATYDLPGFLQHVKSFVAEVTDADRMSLFLTSIGENASVEANVVNQVCIAVRDELRKLPGNSHVFPILTSYVQQKPAELEAALAVIQVLREAEARDAAVMFSVSNPRRGKEDSERALDYLTFLVPVESLFDVALGMYNFELVTVVAKKGQKDPKEYVPFLESLRKLSAPRMRFEIDCRLGRWPSAVANLAAEPTDAAMNQCLQIIRDKRLYRHAVDKVFTEPGPRRKLVYGAYGEYLASKGYHVEAAVCFRRASFLEQELHAYESSGDWAMALFRAKFLKDAAAEKKVVDTFVAQLEAQKRWEDLAKILLWKRIVAVAGEVDDASKAINDALVEAGNWSEALLHGASEEVVAQRVTAAGFKHLSALRGVRVKFNQLIDRLVKLRRDRSSWEQLAAGGGLTATPSEYSDISELSTVSNSTQASATGSLASLAAGRALRRARDEKKKKSSSASSAKKAGKKGKRLTGKPGSMHEEEWLCKELRVLIPGEQQLRETFDMLRQLVLLAEGDAVAQQLQAEQSAFLKDVEAAKDVLLAPATLFGSDGLAYTEIWRPAGTTYVTIAKEYEESRAQEQMVKVQQIVSCQFRWKLALLDDE